MKTLIVGAIRCSLMFLVTASLFSVRPVQAYTVTLEQVGSNVVANGSGAINLTGLTFFGSGVGVLTPGIVADFGTIIMGPSAFVNVDSYYGFTGPRSFGSGDTVFRPNTSSGDAFAFEAPGPFLTGQITAPQGYVSGTALSDSMTFNNATFASLGVTPGTYVWRWGAGANQNFTLHIGAAGVPDGGSTVSLLGCALLGLGALRRKLSC
jgi:VPDSG-CTERM motif